MVAIYVTKRLFDILVSGFLLLILAPVLLIVAIVVRMRLGAPVLFRQERPGKNAKPFTLIKFRTMRSPTEQEIQDGVASDETRITSAGNFLRSTSCLLYTSPSPRDRG